ncbi:MAG: sugar ABC transporter substrate-binding protein [Spartobacteria bacterium]|nr:sugar ABC transporter substrate-binding protein [Spartobacteria bacterium]
MKKVIAASIALILATTVLTGWSWKKKSDDKKTIGIAMPTKSSSRWIADGGNMQEQFEAIGYNVDLQYAEDVVENQIAQLENMITKGVDILVIASIDGESMTKVLEAANDSKIPVIAYDRLIKNSPYVSYYVTFDNFKVGVQQATTLVDALDLNNADGPFYIELFGGSPDDNNAYFFYNGAMSVLDPFIKSGKLIIGSGQTGMDKVSTLRWDGATAQARMDNLLSAFYTDKKIDAVLSPYDGISLGIISSLKGVGYGQNGTPMPFVSGQDAELPSIKSILAGQQYSTIFKDTRALAKQAVGMATALLNEEEAEVNDTTTYDNGVKVVPSYLLESTIVTKDNVNEALVETGYYTADQL